MTAGDHTRNGSPTKTCDRSLLDVFVTDTRQQALTACERSVSCASLLRRWGRGVVVIGIASESLSARLTRWPQAQAACRRDSRAGRPTRPYQPPLGRLLRLRLCPRQEGGQ